MSLTTAFLTLLTICLAVQGLLIAGILRRLRWMSEAQRHGAPSPGMRIRITDEIDGPWPPGVDTLLDGERIAVMLTKGCRACSTLLEELSAKAPGPISVTAVTGPEDLADNEWATRIERLRAAQVPVVVSPKALQDLVGWGHPQAFPNVVWLHDGIVIRSGHRFREIVELVAAQQNA